MIRLMLLTFVAAISGWYGLVLGTSLHPAGSHETMGQHDREHGKPSYLLGHRIGSKRTDLINCCLHRNTAGAEVGDCRIFPADHVLEATHEGVDGYLLFPIDGDTDRAPEFVPATEATVSPDQHHYRCRHPAPVDEESGGTLPQRGSHCLFIPKRWS